MGTAYWEHFEHKADIGVRGFGATLAESFEQAAIALTAVVTDITLIDTTASITVSCNAEENDTLLYDWLNALVYEMATRKMLFAKFEVTIERGKLTATVYGEAIDMQRHQPAVEIKGATYTELDVHRENDQWVAQCVVDV